MSAEETLQKIRDLLEQKMPRTLLKAGTVLDVYQLAGGAVPFRPKVKVYKPKVGPKEPMTSERIHKRLGIKV